MMKIRKLVIALFAIVGALYTLKGSTTAPPSVIYQIQGLEPDLTTLVKAHLAHSLETLTPPLTSNRIRAWNEHVPTEIQQALSPYGYFNPSIHSKLLYQNKTWQAIYTI